MRRAAQLPFVVARQTVAESFDVAQRYEAVADWWNHQVADQRVHVRNRAVDTLVVRSVRDV